MNICLNHRNMTFDFCRHCKGYDIDCPEYLSEYEHTRIQNDIGRKPTSHADKGLTASNIEQKSESYSPKEKPFSWYHSSDRILEPILPRPDFLARFRRYQR